MRKIKHVDIVFENCEVARLTPNMFKGLMIEDIKKSHWINHFQYVDGEDFEITKCSKFSIHILRKGLDFKYSRYNEPRSLEERLNSSKDITSVTLSFEGSKKSEHIYVPWRGGLYTNNAQKHKITPEEVIIHIK